MESTLRVNRTRGILKLLAIAGVVCFSPFLVPQIRSLILEFGENVILNRPLGNPQMWNNMLFGIAFLGMIISIMFFIAMYSDTVKLWGGAILLFGSLFATTKLEFMNSDNAWYAIMGRGIADGNILLTNWIDSTISHYFPYALVEAFWSVFIHNYSIVHAVSIVTLCAMLCWVIWLAIKGLSGGKKPNIVSILTIGAVIMAIEPGTLTNSFAHIAPLLCTLGAAYLYYCRRDSKWARPTVAALLACWTDNYNAPYFLAPILLENILYSAKTKRVDPMAKWVVFGMIAYAIRHAIFRNIGIIVPGAKHIMGMAINVADFNSISGRISNVYLSFSYLFSANFWGKPMLKAIPCIFFAGAMFFSIYLQYNHAKGIAAGRAFEKNRFLTFLILSSVLIFGVQIFSKMGIHTNYLSGAFVNSLIILGWWLSSKLNDHKKSWMVFALVFIMSTTYQVQEKRYEQSVALRERMAIANVIRRENLHNGYAWFGNALSTNFVMNEQRVATLRIQSADPFLWMIEKDVFSRPGKYDFLLAWKDDNGDWGNYDWGDEKIREYFGAPKKTIDEGRIRIYIYDDIRDKVVKPE